MMDYGRAIAKARKRAKLSQRELSKAVGFSPAYVCILESGRRVPSVETVAKLAHACGCTAASIHAEAEKP